MTRCPCDCARAAVTVAELHTKPTNAINDFLSADARTRCEWITGRFRSRFPSWSRLRALESGIPETPTMRRDEAATILSAQRVYRVETSGPASGIQSEDRSDRTRGPEGKDDGLGPDYR